LRLSKYNLSIGLTANPYIGGADVITAEPYVPLTTISAIQEILKEPCR